MYELLNYIIVCFMITVYYFLGGLMMSYFMERFFVDIDYHKHDTSLKSTTVLLLDIVLSIFVINMFALILRIFIRRMPFPFSMLIKNKVAFLIDGGIVLSVSILLFQKKFDDKCKLLSKKFNIT